MNRYGYAMLGSLVAILSSRLYVVLDGSLNFTFDNHVLHHAYYRFWILILAGIVKIIDRKLSMNVISTMIGFALGLIADEMNLFLNIGHAYTLTLYYQPFNYYWDFSLIFLFYTLSRMASPINLIIGNHEEVEI